MKDIPTSPRIALLKRKRRIRRLRLSILFFILFISIVAALSYFSSHHKLLIRNIVVSGNNIVETEEVNTIVNDRLSGKYAYLFSRSNFLIYPEKDIYNNLTSKFHRIEKLSIKRDGLNTLNIFISERAGSYLYCGATLPESKSDIGENCYFVNNDGLIFDKAPYFSGDVYFKFYSNIPEGISNPLGAQVFPPEIFHSLIRFMDNIYYIGLEPSYLVTSSDGVYSLYLKAKGGVQNPKIIFKDDNDLNIIFDNLSTAMEKKEFANEIKSKYSTLLYIDLRFKNKVLYKFE